MYESPTFDQHDHKYIMKPGLKAAVEVALDLGMPLLVTGEPGTGKTKLAKYVAEEMLKCDLLEFYTKTSSKAKDLLYKYNALAHFRETQRTGSDKVLLDYVKFESLGKAILDAGEKRSVVLIDEIDKAPRDFPNDVLFEFEHLAFKVEEAASEEVQAWTQKEKLSIQPDEQGFFRLPKSSPNRPVLILTSNSEKNLPDAFMRRCVYYHIDFPDDKELQQIVLANLKLSEEFQQNMLESAIDHFIEIRSKGLRKKPATAELIAWIHILNQKGIDLHAAKGKEGDALVKEQVLSTYTVLGKNKEDLDRLKDDMR